MKKHTGKVLSLTLALALVVSSLSSTFVSADSSTASGKGTFSVSGPTSVTLANTDSASKAVFNLPTTKQLTATFTDLGGTKYSTAALPGAAGQEAGKVVTDLKISNWNCSNTSISSAATRYVNGHPDSTSAPAAKDVYKISPIKGMTGDVVYTATVVAKVQIDVNTKIDVSTTIPFTVHVRGTGDYAIDAAGKAPGSDFANTASLHRNTSSDIVVYKTTETAGSALLSYSVVTLTGDATTNNGSIASAKVTNGATGAVTLTPAGLGTTYFTVKEGTSPISFSVTTVNTFDTPNDAKLSIPFGETKTKSDKGGSFDIDGYNINALGDITVNNGNVGKISGGNTITINGGTVGSIDASGDVIINGGTVGSVKTSARVIIKAGTVSSVESTYAPDGSDIAIQINGGTVIGDVIASADAYQNLTTLPIASRPEIVIESTNKDAAVVIGGNVKTAGEIYIGSKCSTANATDAQKAACTVTIKGNVSAQYGMVITGIPGESDAAVTVNGKVSGLMVGLGASNATVGGVAPSSVLKYSDNTKTVDSEFGTFGYNGKLDTIAGFYEVILLPGANASHLNTLEVGSALNTNILNLGSNTLLKADTGAYVNDLKGSGSIQFPAGTLSIAHETDATQAASVTLIPTGSYSKGSTIFKALAGYNANPAIAPNRYYNVNGMTLVEQKTSTNVVNYNVDTMTLLGLTLPDTAKVANGGTASIAAVTNPTGAGLPAGYSVKWSTPAGSYVTVEGTGMTATIKGVNYSNVTNSPLNVVTVTAQIVDANGVPYKAAATCLVTVTKSPDTLSLDKTDVFVVPGKTVTVAASSNTTVAATSADNNIANASVANGVITITGVSIGKTTIKVVAGDQTKTINVTVANATLTLDKTAFTLRAGSQSKIGYGDKNAYGKAILTVTGDTATMPTVVSSDPTVATATVAKTATAGVYTIVVAGIKAGTANITATVNGVTSSPIVVTVTKAAAGYLQIDTANYTMAPGGVYDIGCIVSGVPTIGAKTLTVTTSRDAIATVTKLSNGNYRIKAVKPGTAYISFTIGNTHASVKIDVVAGAKAGGTSTRATSFFD